MTNYEWIKSLPADMMRYILYNICASLCADCPARKRLDRAVNDDLTNKQEFDNAKIFSYALSEALEKGANKFKCPICGNEAQWEADDYSGYVCGKCDSCGIKEWR